MKTWFVTGAGRGLGATIVRAAAAAGDRAVATGRDLGALERRFGGEERVLCLPLDVADGGAAEAALAEARRRFGSIDVLVNNAGYGLLGAIEEVSDAELRALFDTDFFGLLNVTRAAIPHLRATGGGHVVNVGSSAGACPGPGIGAYAAAKAAVAAASEALAAELAPLGIAVTVVEPGALRTDFLSPGSFRYSERILDAYADGPVGALRQGAKGGHGLQPGDPAKAVALIRELVAADRPPVRLALGADALAATDEARATQIRELEPWREAAGSIGRDDA
ncbi:MAG: SDR family NAD(P)-dependent oxidoreductase [Solirubrobacterales bacterium]